MQTKQYFTNRIATEIELTLNAFNTIPEEQADYKPHPKARTARQLADHITAHVFDLIQGIENPQVEHDVFSSYPTIAEAAAALDRGSRKLLDLLAITDENTWSEKVLPVLVLGHKIHDLTLENLCFNWMYDVIHHRGQLSTYFRAMGTLPPYIYGPNAEQTEAMFAQSASN